MTRIITITGGLDGIGKTQLAVNLALELVRRGRFAAVFQDRAAHAALDEVLSLPGTAPLPQRRADDVHDGDAERAGYQGVDLLGCRVGLDDWAACEPGRLERCFRELDSADGYDDLLVDTSAMSAQAVLASCLSAHFVLVTVTPESASQAQAFAMLRILRLNGFSGVLRLVVNRARYLMDGQDILQLLGMQTRRYLGMDLSLVQTLTEDPNVRLAQRYRQAFTALFPETEASAGIIVLADQLEDFVLPDRLARRPLVDFWGSLRAHLERDMRLPGRADPESLRVGQAGPAA